jgi:hypothetical protein
MLYINGYAPLNGIYKSRIRAGKYAFTTAINTPLTAPTPPEISDEISRSVAVKEGR